MLQFQILKRQRCYKIHFYGPLAVVSTQKINHAVKCSEWCSRGPSWSPRSIITQDCWKHLFDPSLKFTLVNPRHHQQTEDQTLWEVIKWKWYRGNNIHSGNGKEAKRCAGSPLSWLQARLQAAREQRWEARLYSMGYSMCWSCDVGLDTEPPLKLINEAAEVSFVPCVTVECQWPFSAKYFIFVIRDQDAQANTAQPNTAQPQWLTMWDPTCLGFSKFLPLTKSYLLFFEG